MRPLAMLLRSTDGENGIRNKREKVTEGGMQTLARLESRCYALRARNTSNESIMGQLWAYQELLIGLNKICY
jgi:hypothetical protein